MIVAPPEQKHSISNMGKGHEIRLADTEAGRRVLIELYIDKVYTDKVWAVVREYCTNAMDANIAAGRGDLPIEITLPYINRGNWANNFKTDKSNTFRVRDFGEGLDENEIDQIFIVLGESTKRLDNSQTGNMGIGAKSGFAYGEFTVTSIKDGKKWHYLAKRNDSNAPTLIPIGLPQDTTEHSGITIEFQVKDSDIDSFRNRSFFLGQFAKVRPKYINDFGHTFQDLKPEMEGDSWAIIKRGSNYIDQFNVVMANICYICRDVSLLQELQAIIDTRTHGLVINVGPGDVSIPPSREELEYTDLTRRTISKHLKSLKDAIQKRADAEFVSAKNLFEAFAKFRNFNTFFKINQFNWNGKTYDGSFQFKNICATVINRRGRKISYDKYEHYLDDKGNKVDFECNILANAFIHKSAKVITNLNSEDTRTNRWKLNTISGFSGNDRLVSIESIPSEYGTVDSELDWNTVAITKPAKAASGKFSYSDVYEYDSKSGDWSQLDNDEIPDGEKVFVILSSNMGVVAHRIDMGLLSTEINGAFTIYGIRSSKLEKVLEADKGWIAFDEKIKAMGKFKYEVSELPYIPKYYTNFKEVFYLIKSAKSYHKLIEAIDSAVSSGQCPYVLKVRVSITDKQNDTVYVDPVKIPSKIDSAPKFKELESQFPWIPMLFDEYIPWDKKQKLADIVLEDAALKNIVFC